MRIATPASESTQDGVDKVSFRLSHLWRSSSLLVENIREPRSRVSSFRPSRQSIIVSRILLSGDSAFKTGSKFSHIQEQVIKCQCTCKGVMTIFGFG